VGLPVPRKFPLESEEFNPFGALIGLSFSECKNGYSRCALEVREKLFNPNRVLHGGVVYSLADTGMGAALHSDLAEDELCATIEIKIVYFAAVTSGILSCETKVIHRSKRIAVLESEIRNDGRVTAKAMGTFSVSKVKGEQL
jgi:acyl-CoA thioesterase